MKKAILTILCAACVFLGVKYVLVKEAADLSYLTKNADEVKYLPGGDLATNYFASKVWNPYDNRECYEAFLEGKLDFPHPNPAMRYLPLKNIPITRKNGTMEIMDYFGFVATPWVLLHFKVLSAIPFMSVYTVWPWLSLLVLSSTVFLYSYKIFDSFPIRQRIAAALLCTHLLGLFFFPVMNSSFHFMQLELLYIPPLAAGMVLFLFYRNKTFSPALIGFLLAYAIGVKVFPAIFLLAAIVLDTANYAVHRRTLFLGIIKWTFIAGLLYLLFLSLFIDVEVILSWLRKGMHYPRGTTTALGGNLLYTPTLKDYVLTVFSIASPGAIPLRAANIVSFLLKSCTVLFVTLAVRPSRNKISGLGREQCMTFFSLLIALLPTLMPHWSVPYNVIMMIPFVNCLYLLTRFRPSVSMRGIQNEFGYFAACLCVMLSYTFMNYYISIMAWGIDSDAPPLAAELIFTYPAFLLLAAGTLFAHRWATRFK
ncbi:MAG: hypothetical protein ACWGN7_07560 [Thermodesulfovibrionales bacterium]